MKYAEVSWRCNLGAPTNRPQIIHSLDECLCEASCEPHIHEDEDTILCMHDGENDHGHCPVPIAEYNESHYDNDLPEILSRAPQTA